MDDISRGVWCFGGIIGMIDAVFSTPKTPTDKDDKWKFKSYRKNIYKMILIFICLKMLCDRQGYYYGFIRLSMPYAIIISRAQHNIYPDYHGIERQI